MHPIIALPHPPASVRHILPLEDTRQAVHLQRRNVMPEPAAAPVVPPTVFRKGLLLHCGAEAVDRGTLSHVETPSCTESWFPLPHDFLLKEVESQLTAHGFGLGKPPTPSAMKGNGISEFSKSCVQTTAPATTRGSSASATPTIRLSRPLWSWERVCSFATTLPSTEK